MGEKPLDQYCWCNTFPSTTKKFLRFRLKCCLNQFKKLMPSSLQQSLYIAASKKAHRYQKQLHCRATAERYRAIAERYRAIAERYKHCRPLQYRATTVSVKNSSSLCVLNVSVDKTFLSLQGGYIPDK
jgi:hypothetical protein